MAPTIERCGSLNHVKMLWKKLRKVIERLGRLVELYAKCMFRGKT
jgi:hypothetical protein